MIYFFAKYRDRITLLEMGAKWDFDRGMWYVEDERDYAKFSSWLQGDIFTKTLYILETTEVCPFCKTREKLFAIACGEYTEQLLPTVYGRNSINILYGLEHIPLYIERFFIDKFKLKKRFSRAYGYEYTQNGCSRCNEVFTDSYLFDDEESPFFVSSEEKAKSIKIHELKLEEHIFFKGIVKWSFDNNLFIKSKRVPIERKAFEYVDLINDFT